MWGLYLEEKYDLLKEARAVIERRHHRKEEKDRLKWTDGEVEVIEEIKPKALKMINEKGERMKRVRKLEIMNWRKIQEMEKRQEYYRKKFK